MKISIIGAGISGLSAAYYLNRLKNKYSSDLEISIFEQSSRAGGNIYTNKAGDFVIEEGADSFITSKPWAIQLCKDLGLENQLISTNDKNRKTYVYFDGKLNELPSGFFLMAPSNLEAFEKSQFFSESARKRILKEQFIDPKADSEDESLKSFVERRFGNELLKKIAQPLIGGIYTGDPAKLSINAVLPEFVSMEKEFGSVIKGISEKYGASGISKTESGARYSLFVSFRDGLSTLTEGVVQAMPHVEIFYNHGISRVVKSDNKWLLESDEEPIHEADGVILATPSYVSSKLISETDYKLSGLLSKIEYESSVVVTLLFDKTKIGDLPKGFGVVIPETEKMNLIACSFSAHKFANRAPKNHDLIRCFLGGAFDHNVLEKNDTEIMKLVMEDLNKIFKIDVEPERSSISRFPNSMPQYNLGYTELLNTINSELGKYTNLALSGNAYGGIGIPDSIKSGNDAAEYIFRNIDK